MSSRKVGATNGVKGICWGAVALGWVVAVFTGIVISTILRQMYRLLTELPVERGEFTATVVVISSVSGFLSYLIGGYAAAKTARHSGGKHGALTAVFGLIVGIILSLIGVVFTEGVAVPPAAFGPIGAAWVAGLILFLVNLFGAFVGGKLGEPSDTDVKHPGSVPDC
ncbi:MAG: hypothetical protein QOI57_1368 [Rubrobacteraceae bacterium]|jgi:hypothetical protein|nr:hypothetical protein [Rubrobacteraceae bacterium]